MKSINRKILFFFLILITIFSLGANFAFALEIEDYPPVLGVTMPANPGLPDYARYFFNLGMVVAVSLAALVIIIGGIYWIVSMGSGKITHEGKEWVMAGIKGLVLLLCSYLIAVTINPALVHPKLEGLTPILPWQITPTTPTEPIIPTITYQEIPIGTLTENVLARAINCYDFDENGNPIDGDSSTPDILEPTLLNHDRIDCILKLAEAAERKAEIFKELSEKIADLMKENCKCDWPITGGGGSYSPKNNNLAEKFEKWFSTRGIILTTTGSCNLNPGDWDYCKTTKCGPCNSGEGDCDSNSECKSGLFCIDNIGAKYGYKPDVDVCEEVPAPYHPIGFKAISLIPNSIFLTWRNAVPVKGTYIIRKAGGYPADNRSDPGSTLIFDGSGQSYVDKNLTYGTLYCYRAWNYIEVSGQKSYSKKSATDCANTQEGTRCIANCTTCEYKQGQCPRNKRDVGKEDLCSGDCVGKNCECETSPCDPCRGGIRQLIERGPIPIGEIEYAGLDEFRTQYPLCSEPRPPYPYIKCIADDRAFLDIVETEVVINNQRIRIIRIEIYRSLRLIDQLRYLKEKINTISIEQDLNLLKAAENKLGECYLAKTYVDFLKLVEETKKTERNIQKEKPFIDPFTNQPVDVSRYCKGFNWNESQCFNACQNICPGINEQSFQLFKSCPVNNLNCLKQAFYTCPIASPPNTFGFNTFQDCLTNCRNNCLQKCQQRYPSQQGSAYQECIDKCNNDSKCFLNYTAQDNQTGDNVLIKDNVEKCYSNLLGFKACADKYPDDFFGFKNCAEMAFRCEYASDQQAGYPECSKREEYSSLFLYQNPNYQKNPYCFQKTVNGITYDGVEQYPELWKCPSCSDCPKCPCLNENCTSIEERCLISSGQCGEFAYNDDPLTFYCRENWREEEEEKKEKPLGKERFCDKADEIPIGQTVDETEKWAEELAKLIREFINQTENMIEYIKRIGKEKDYCECDSVCLPNAQEGVCQSGCKYNQVEVPIIDPETGEPTGETYWVCYCVFVPCRGNPCQKMINLLLGKKANDKCPQGIEYKGVGWYYEQIKTALEDLERFAIEERSEILKKLIYSREKINECSAIAASFGSEVKLLSCKRVKDEIISPIVDGKVLIGNETLEKHCYGQEAGKILKIGPLLDNWFCCEMAVPAK